MVSWRLELQLKLDQLELVTGANFLFAPILFTQIHTEKLLNSLVYMLLSELSID